MDICCKRFSRRRSARWRRAGPELGGVCVCWSSTRLCRSASGCRRGCKSDLYKCAELWNRLSLSVKLGWILISMIDRLFIAEMWSWWQTSVLTDIMKRKKHLGATRMMPQVPATQAKLKIQRRILQKCWLIFRFYFFKVLRFVCLCKLCVYSLCFTCQAPSPHTSSHLPPEKHFWLRRNTMIVIMTPVVALGDGDLVVSVLILDMLGNEAHRVDRFLKMRLLTKLTLSQSIVTIVTILFLY